MVLDFLRHQLSSLTRPVSDLDTHTRARAHTHTHTHTHNRTQTRRAEATQVHMAVNLDFKLHALADV